MIRPWKLIEDNCQVFTVIRNSINLSYILITLWLIKFIYLVCILTLQTLLRFYRLETFEICLYFFIVRPILCATVHNIDYFICYSSLHYFAEKIAITNQFIRQIFITEKSKHTASSPNKWDFCRHCFTNLIPFYFNNSIIIFIIQSNFYKLNHHYPEKNFNL